MGPDRSPSRCSKPSVDWKALGHEKFYDPKRPPPNAGESIGEVWGRQDPTAALAWVSTLPSGRRDVTSKICQAWARRDPAAALDWASKSGDPSLLKEIQGAAISALAAKDLPAALARLESLPAGDEHDAALAAAVEGVSKSDPGTATRLLNQLPAGTARDEAAFKFCQKWSATDPRAALDWLCQNASLPKSPDRLDELDGLMRKWLENSPEAAVTWTRSLPAGDRRDALLGSAVSALAASDLSTAQSLFEELSPEARDRAAGPLAEHLAMQDLDQARQWAALLPSGPAQAAALQQITNYSAGVDPVETAQWLNTLPAGPARDRAIIPFTREIQKNDPEGAVTWALSVADPQDRQNRLDELVQIWKDSDPKSARTWISSCPDLTPAVKRHLLTQ